MTREQRDRAIVRHVVVFGWTYQRVADKFGVTRQRAWQIVREAQA